MLQSWDTSHVHTRVHAHTPLPLFYKSVNERGVLKLDKQGNITASEHVCSPLSDVYFMDFDEKLKETQDSTCLSRSDSHRSGRCPYFHNFMVGHESHLSEEEVKMKETGEFGAHSNVEQI